MQRIPIRLQLMALAVLLALGAQPLAHAVERTRQYTVKPGDTLGGISASLGVPVARLVELNNLTDADHILAGRTLMLPDETAAAGATSPAPPPTPTTREYVVRPGDSLSRIAASLGVAVSALVDANKLGDPDRLTVGQKLQVPAGQASGGAAARPSSGAGPAPAAGSGSPLGGLLAEAAGRHGMDAALVKSLAFFLSAWRPDATSPTGAVGVMQITANTQEWVGQVLLKRPLDRAEPRDNVEIGVAYLAYLVQKLGDERQGVAAYLQGPAGLARSGVNPSTARALEVIYGGRGRFAGEVESAAAPSPSLASTPPRELAASVLAAGRGVAPEARVGVAALHLVSGQRVEVRADEVFPSASVNKVPILAEAFRQVEAGKLARGAVIPDLERMITLSDNEAANRLLDTVGEPNVNATMARLGLGSTALRNYFSANRGPADPGFNQTSPSDMAALFGALAADRLVSAGSSQEMRALLFRTQDHSKLARGLPPGTRLAHKSGWYAGVANDVGIVYAPRGAYVLAVFTQGTPDSEVGNQLVAAVSRVVYLAWGQ